METQPMHHGSMAFIAAVETTVATGGTYVKAAGATIAMECSGFSHSDNRLTYAGQMGRTFSVQANVSMTTSAATNAFITIFKNGEKICSSAAIKRYVSVGTDVGAAGVGVMVKLKKDDYIELWLTTDDGDEVTIEAGSIVVTVAG